MNAPHKRTAAETWKALQDMEEDDAAERDMERVLAMSPEELARELAQDGIDPDAARARGEALGREVARKLADVPVVPPRRRFGGTAVVLLAAAAAVALVATWGGAGAAIARWLRPPAPQIGPDVPGPAEIAEQHARERAHELRGAAHIDCLNSHWVPCVQELDDARALDPAGDADPEVQEERETATKAMTPVPLVPQRDKP